VDNVERRRLRYAWIIRKRRETKENEEE